mgnify:CR=1 FL=1
MLFRSFYYHEGDNPLHEKSRIDALCEQHSLPLNGYRFISGNTQANNIENFIYFPDHELFYWRNGVVWNNQPQPGCEAHLRPRTHNFTALSRVHKWWRATVMCYLQREGLLDNSYWSYNTIDMGDQYCDNPIELWSFNIENDLHNFVAGAPYTCDTLNATEHNSHWTLVREHYEDSYCNLVLETFFDADGSNGAFISEKTFKPIRHAQPFVIFGTPGTLATLRSLGYRTFDHAIDNTYDTIENNDLRTQAVVKQLAWYCSLSDKEKTDVMHAVEPIVLHNFHHFYSEFRHIITRELLDNTKTVYKNLEYHDNHINYNNIYHVLTS